MRCNLEKYQSFFGYAKHYFWLINQKRIGNLERAIIREYHTAFINIMEETSLEEFKEVWNRLSVLRMDETSKKEEYSKKWK